MREFAGREVNEELSGFVEALTAQNKKGTRNPRRVRANWIKPDRSVTGCGRKWWSGEADWSSLKFYCWLQMRGGCRCRLQVVERDSEFRSLFFTFRHSEVLSEGVNVLREDLNIQHEECYYENCNKPAICFTLHKKKRILSKTPECFLCRFKKYRPDLLRFI